MCDEPLLSPEPFEVSKTRLEYADISWEGFKLVPAMTIDKETANELLKMLEHTHISYKNERIHELIKRMWVFVGKVNGRVK